MTVSCIGRSTSGASSSESRQWQRNDSNPIGVTHFRGRMPFRVVFGGSIARGFLVLALATPNAVAQIGPSSARTAVGAKRPWSQLSPTSDHWREEKLQRSYDVGQVARP